MACNIYMYICYKYQHLSRIIVQNMFSTGIIDEIIQVFKDQNEFPQLWQIRNVLFDIDPEEQSIQLEKYIHISYNVQDIKGNPGQRGHLFITNLRLIWRMASDHYINLSVGLDAILKININTIPVAGKQNLKYELVLKVQNPNQKRYTFKFMGHNENQLHIFQYLRDLHAQVTSSRSYRSINLAVSSVPQFTTLDRQQIKSQYTQVIFKENSTKIDCQLLLTNVRIVIIKNKQSKMNYGIPWIMIKTLSLSEQKDYICFKTRGILRSNKLELHFKNIKKLKQCLYQLKSFIETYSKLPVLGYEYKRQKYQENIPQFYKDNIEQIQSTKINLIKRKQAYSSSNDSGSLNQIVYNKQIGLMMQSFPQGTTRSSLWDIIS